MRPHYHLLLVFSVLSDVCVWSGKYRNMGTIFSDVLRRNKYNAKRGHLCLMSAGFPFTGYYRLLARFWLCLSQLEFCASSLVLSLVIASLSARIHTLSQLLRSTSETLVSEKQGGVCLKVSRLSPMKLLPPFTDKKSNFIWLNIILCPLIKKGAYEISFKS